MAVVQNALSSAWRVLLEDVAKGNFSICTAKEDEITEELEIILGELHAAEPEQVPGFSTFSMVRERKLRNHNRKKLDCQPDLAFYPLRGAIPTTNSVLAGIFVECKPIDSRHPVHGTYCKEGLIRFVRGDYAWAVDRALMVAYVRNRCLLPGGLEVCIEKDRMHQKCRFEDGLVDAGTTSHGDAVYRSVHGRDIPHLSSYDTPAPIIIHHLWLYPNDPCETSQCQGSK